MTNAKPDPLSELHPLRELQQVIDADERGHAGELAIDVQLPRPMSAVRAGLLAEVARKHSSALDEITRTARQAISDCEQAMTNCKHAVDRLKTLIGER